MLNIALLQNPPPSGQLDGAASSFVLQGPGEAIRMCDHLKNVTAQKGSFEKTLFITTTEVKKNNPHHQEKQLFVTILLFLKVILLICFEN